MKNKTYHKKKILVVFTCAFLILTGLIGRLVYLMVFDAEYYQKRAEDLHKRERKIKAARGEIVDRNGVVLVSPDLAIPSADALHFHRRRTVQICFLY